MADASKLVLLYALVSRMRVLSSQVVIDEADRVMKRIVETYQGPNKSLRDIVAYEPNSDVLDPLRDFSNACRQELKAASRHR